PERVVAAGATAGGPEVVLAALRRARITADAADTAMDGLSRPLPFGGSGRTGTLVIYAVLAVVAIVLLACAGVGVLMLLR
ncbi:hypothetical protein ACFQ0D_13180, partial [Micromonospora zhanjiangensis]